jgi:hypothetical protein
MDKDREKEVDESKAEIRSVIDFLRRFTVCLITQLYTELNRSPVLHILYFCLVLSSSDPVLDRACMSFDIPTWVD